MMKKRLNIKIIVAVLLILLTVFGLVLLSQKENKEYRLNTSDVLTYKTFTTDNITYDYKDNLRTYLLMGIDGAGGEPLLGQADFLSLVIVDNKKEDIKVLVIPRDTIAYFDVCDSKGNVISSNHSHINLAYASGGDGTYLSEINEVKAVSNLLNSIPITGYIAMPLDILSDVVDIMGEAEVVLTDDSLSYLNSDLVEGTVFKINKNTVEEYVRSRDIWEDYSAGDRTSRQIIYMNYLLSKFNDIKNRNLDVTFHDLDSLLAKCESNLTNNQLSDLYDEVIDYGDNNEFIILPGDYQVNNVSDEYIVNEDEYSKMLVNLFYEKN